jgi:hypothetical protein
MHESPFVILAFIISITFTSISSGELLTLSSNKAPLPPVDIPVTQGIIVTHFVKTPVLKQCLPLYGS